MKRLLLLYTFIASLVAVHAQSVDVTKVTADTKTYLFNDGKNTVKNYIYDRLQAQTSCCGSDRIYLEVKVDPSGYVVSAKALTGKNDCFKDAVVDIVKNIKWDASDFTGPKSIFFEVKPDLPCEGRKNEYAKIPTFNNPMINPTTGLPKDYFANQVQPAPTKAPDPIAQPTQPVATTPTQPVAVAPTQPVATTPTQPVVTAPTQPVVSPTPTPVPAVAQPVVAAVPPRIPVTPGTVPSIGANPVAVTPPTPSVAPAKMPVPPAPVKAGPTPEELAKARETADEVAALRAEMDKRMKDEENKNKAAAKTDDLLASADKPGEKAAGDKKAGVKDEGDDWGMDKTTGKKTKRECKDVLNKDGKPLVDKNGKPVQECKTVFVEDKVAEPVEPKLTPEQIAAKKKADDEAAKAAAEATRLAKMTPEERKKADEEKHRKDEENRLVEIEKAATNRVADAEKKVRDAEAAQRKIQDDMKRQETDMKRAQEDLERAKTEAQRQKDEAEVARIESEKRTLDEKKKEQERAIQEKMREMQKMQSDVERLTGDLQKQQEDLRKAEEKLTQTKQNIATRANGGVVINTDAPIAMPKIPTEPKKADKVEVVNGDTATVNKLMMQIDLLRQQIYRMQQEMDAARSVNSAYNNRPVAAPTTSTVYSQGTSASANKDWAAMNYTQPQAMPVPAAPGTSTNGPRNSVESQSAAANRAWESVDYTNTEALSKTTQGRDVIMTDLKAGKNLDSKAERSTGKAAPAPAPAPTKAAPAPAPQPKVQVTSAPVVATPVPAVVTSPAAVPTGAQAPVAYVSTGDKNPDASHVGTFSNVPVAANAQLEFIDGDQGMKNYLRDKLKEQGVCGLAHVIAEVNVDRNGNVTSYKVLKSVPDDLVTKVPSVILGMKFKTNPATAPYTQTTYVEFKGDIRCEGKPASKVNVKNEEDFLKTEKK